MRSVEPTKAFLLDALHYFGIAQLLGIDEGGSQNIITPFETNNNFKGTIKADQGKNTWKKGSQK